MRNSEAIIYTDVDRTLAVLASACLYGLLGLVLSDRVASVDDTTAVDVSLVSCSTRGANSCC